MDSKGIWTLIMLLFFFVNSCKYACSNDSNEEDMNLEQQLKILNKPPIKTIMTDEGDTIDCIDIYKQPAFDHPLLKNHKIQLHPTSFPNDLAKTSSEMKNTQLRFMKEACPSGTIPIKRTSKEDLIRTKSLIEQLPGVNLDNNINGAPNKIVSVIVKSKGTPYYGGTGAVTIYNLSVPSDQSSSTNMWIDSGVSQHDINFITTGWKVSKRLNGDSLTRLFTYWAGGKKTRGCFNTLCPGFIVTNNMVGPNVPLTTSSIRGVEWFVLKLIIFQDRPTGNWWLGIKYNNTVIGYWPKEIFSRLQNGAERVSWGGSVHPGDNGIYPPMGNGFKPHSYDDTCFFVQAHYIDANNNTVSPFKGFEQITEQRDPSGCYGLVNDGDWGSKKMGYALMFGGPGGNC